jgi:hypothetical protein
MAEDGLTYSEAVRAAAAEAAAAEAAAALGTIPEAVRAAPALGTLPEAVRQRAPRTRRHPGNSGKARVLLDVDAEKDKPAPRKRPDVQPADAQMIATLEACVSDLRSMLAKAEERSSDERARCDRLTAEAMSANARAAHLDGELTALRSYRPWWRRLIALAALAPWPPMRRRSPAGPE